MTTFPVKLLALALSSYMPATGPALPQNRSVAPLARQSEVDKAEQRRIRNEASRRIALEWAKAQGQPISGRIVGGATYELVGMDNKRPIYYLTMNHFAADTVGADELWDSGSSGLALSGNGVILGIWDGGPVLTTHCEFGGRAVQLDSQTIPHPNPDHATHVAGTMIAAGVNPAAKGMAGAAQLHCYDWTSDIVEMWAQANTPGLHVSCSNHSYGDICGWVDFEDTGWTWCGDPHATHDDNFGHYDTRAHEFDDIMYGQQPYGSTDYLVCVAAGNGRGWAPTDQPAPHQHLGDSSTYTDVHDPNGAPYGFNSLVTTATAKNTLTIGAVKPIPGGYRSITDVVIAGAPANAPAWGSAWGPTQDGRIKPDICADGWELVSCLASDNGSSSNSTYSDGHGGRAKYSGTSMACASVSGAAALLVEHYRNTHHGATPRAATLKAAMIHTADDAGSSGPDYVFGWGLLDARAAADLISLDSSLEDTIIEDTLDNEQTWTRTFSYDPTFPLKATIAWTDPAGPILPLDSDPQARVLVNDLDLRIVSHDGTVYEPWVLDPGEMGASASRGDNDRDNIEQVVASPVTGEVTVRVTHKGTLSEGHQAFSLIVTGVSPHTQRTTRVSVSSDGTQANSYSWAPSVSADGRYVAFTSNASNLVPNDTNGTCDVFVSDSLTGATECISVTPSGIPGDNSSGGNANSVISADGRYVAFESMANNLLPAGTIGGNSHVYIRDRQAGTTQLISLALDNTQENCASCWDWSIAMSPDSRYVVFDSLSSNLISNDTNSPYCGAFDGDDVFLRDRIQSISDRANVTTGGTETHRSLNFSYAFAVSADGRYVVFTYYQEPGWVPALTPNDTNNCPDVFVRDRILGTTTRVSVNSTGEEANNWSGGFVGISGDGRYVVFQSAATNLVDGHSNAGFDTYIRDTVADTTQCVSVDPQGHPAGSSASVAISQDGRYVAFSSPSAFLVDNDTNGAIDVFVRDQVAGVTERVSVSSSGTESNGDSNTFSLMGLNISSNGRYIAYQSVATNLVDGDTNGMSDIFLCDRMGAATVSSASTINEGGSASLASTFQQTPGWTYQWRRNGMPIVGAIDPNAYDVITAHSTDDGWYDVQGTDGTTTVSSIPVHVSVVPQLAFWKNPDTVRALPGGSATFTAGPVGWPIDSFQWLKDDVPIPGNDQPMLVIHDLQESDLNHWYSVQISNARGTVTSGSAWLSNVTSGPPSAEINRPPQQHP